MKKFTIGALVRNHFGVLNRITGLFSKRGYNIDSLAVGETENPDISRITFVCSGDEYVQGQVVRQFEKLHDVHSVMVFDENTVSTEHMLIKIRLVGNCQAGVSKTISDFGGRVCDFGADYVIAELTAPTATIDRFIEAVRELGILETCRSGALAMALGRGKSEVRNAE